MGDTVSRGPGGLATALAETARFLNQKQPGLVNEHTHLFTSVEELLASDYARQHPFTAEQIASLRSAEGFHDTETGHSFVIAENTRLLPGESPQQALTRVILHERVGHGGLHILLGSTDSARSRRWAALSAQIPLTELEAIAAETGYSHLAGRREDLAFEWFARRTEKELNLLEKGSLPRQMWDAFREMVMDFMARVGLRPTLGRSFETQVKDLQRRAREAALRPVRDSTNAGQSAPDSFRPQAMNDAGNATSLDDVNHLFTSPSNNPHDGSLAPHLPSLPPIWQGRARHGEDAAVLGRNPDGTFQVRLNGTEKTFKESQVAAMTGMQRGPLYAHLAQATRQQLALPHPPSLPPIWQGRARHGEDAAVLGRNPDGTFQVRLNGTEKTFKESQVAAMTGMQRGPLYEMLERATLSSLQADSIPDPGGGKGDDANAPATDGPVFANIPLPLGRPGVEEWVDPGDVTFWDERLAAARVIDAVDYTEVVSNPTADLGPLNRLQVHQAIQSFLNLISGDIVRAAGSFELYAYKEILDDDGRPVDARGEWAPSNREKTDDLARQHGPVIKLTYDLAEKEYDLRSTIWHEMTHWLWDNADKHPRLKKWRHDLERHFAERTAGEQRLWDSDGGYYYWKDGWIGNYSGRDYPGRPPGVELPTTYMQLLCGGGSRVARWEADKSVISTFELVMSILGDRK